MGMHNRSTHTHTHTNSQAHTHTHIHTHTHPPPPCAPPQLCTPTHTHTHTYICTYKLRQIRVWQVRLGKAGFENRWAEVPQEAMTQNPLFLFAKNSDVDDWNTWGLYVLLDEAVRHQMLYLMTELRLWNDQWKPAGWIFNILKKFICESWARLEFKLCKECMWKLWILVQTTHLSTCY